MKVIYFLIFTILGGVSIAQHPLCSNTLYSASSQSLVFFNNGLAPGNATSIPISDVSQLAIASSFSFPGPNPAFWTMVTVSGIQKPCYFNGTTWTVTPHNFPFVGQCRMAGNQNYLYTLFGQNTVYRYSGTANAALQGTIGPLINQIVVDDQDNIYGLRTNVSPTLIVYDAQLLPICGYSLNGLPLNGCSAFAINGNTVNVGMSGDYYVGLMTGSVINFTQTSPPIGGYATTNLTSCHRLTTFSSTISSVSGPSLYCQQTNTLTISSPAINVSTYQWSGPGLVSQANSSVATVNLPGVYTCTILTTDCPSMKSISSYTVINAGGFFTPTLSTTGNLTCLNPTTQISAFPNSAQHTYSWSGPGIVGPSTTPTIDAASAGIYNVLVTNTLTGCSSTAQVGITSSIGPLNINSSTGDLYLCTPLSTQTITATGANTYTWSPNIAISTTLGAAVTITPGSSPAYTVVGTLGVCSGYTVVNIFVTPSPTLVTNLSNTTICNGNMVGINVSGAYAYTWSPGGLNSQSIAVNPPSTTIYTVTGNFGGCLSSTEVTVNVNPNPIITISSTYSRICTGFSTTLNAFGAQSFTWYPGPITSSSIIATPTTSQVYTVVGTNPFGCTSNADYTVSVSNWFPLVISPSSPTLCQNQQFTLSMTSSYGYNLLYWTGPNIITTLPPASAVISPSVNSVYTLTAINGADPFFPACNRTATTAVTVYSAPVIGVVASSTNICLGTTVTLTPSGALSYSLGNPAVQTGPLYTLSPASSQNYTVYGINALNCLGSKTVQIVVTPTPNISINSSNFNICPGGTAGIVASGANTYTWNPGGLTGNYHQVSPQATTIYTVTGSIGICTSNNTLQLNAVQNPTLTVSPASATVCSGGTISALANGAANYTWLPGNFIGSVLTGTALTNTQYTVVGANAFNCLDTAYVNIHVNQNPNINLAAQPGTICAGGSSTLSASGASNFTWQPGSYVGSTYTISAQATAIYTVTGLSGSCASSSTISVAVNPYPNLLVTTSPSLICSGQQSTLSVSGASTYSWINTGQTSSSIQVNPGTTSTYSVLGTSLDCTIQQTVQVFVHPILLQVSSSQSTICAGESATITASGALSYSFNPGGIVSNIIITPSLTTTYSVSGTDANGCITSTLITQNVDACTGLDNTAFSVQSPLFKFYPNPNTGMVYFESSVDCDLRIINTLGQTVYSTSIDSGTHKMSTESLAKGVYSIRLTYAKDTQTYLLIKE